MTSRRTWLVLIALVALIACFLAACGGSEQYEARAKVLVGPITGDVETIRDAVAFLPTATVLADEAVVVKPVAVLMGVSQDEVRTKVRVTTNSDLRLLSIQATAAELAEATALANAVAEELASLTEKNPPGQALHVIEKAD